MRKLCCIIVSSTLTATASETAYALSYLPYLIKVGITSIVFTAVVCVSSPPSTLFDFATAKDVIVYGHNDCSTFLQQTATSSSVASVLAPTKRHRLELNEGRISDLGAGNITSFYVRIHFWGKTQSPCASLNSTFRFE